MSAGAQTSHNLAADTNSSSLAIETSGATLAFASYVTSKKPAAVTAYREQFTTAATAAGSVAALSKYAMADSIHVLLSARFSVASQSAVFALALYDAAGALIGMTRDYGIRADASYTDGSKYLSLPEIVDVGPATQVGIICRTPPDSGNVDVYIEAL